MLHYEFIAVAVVRIRQARKAWALASDIYCHSETSLGRGKKWVLMREKSLNRYPIAAKELFTRFRKRVT